MFFLLFSPQESAQVVRQTTPLCRLIRDIANIGHAARVRIVTQRFLSFVLPLLPTSKQQTFYDAR